MRVLLSFALLSLSVLPPRCETLAVASQSTLAVRLQNSKVDRPLSRTPDLRVTPPNHLGLALLERVEVGGVWGVEFKERGGVPLVACACLGASMDLLSPTRSIQPDSCVELNATL